MMALGLLGACDPVTHTLGVLSGASSGGQLSTPPLTSGGTGGSGGAAATGGSTAPTSGGQNATGGGGTTTRTGGAATSGGTPATGTGGQTALSCGAVQVEPGRPQMVVVIDTAFTLPVNFLNPTAEGIKQFIFDPRSGGMDMGLYVLQPNCNSAAYSQPEVDVGQLPAHAAALAAGVPSSQFNLTQPELAMRAAAARTQALEQASKPEDSQAVVFITDGVGGGLCTPSTPQDLIAAIEEAQSGTSPVDTYIVSLTVPDLGTSQWSTGPTADELAAAGGTGSAYEASLVTSNADGLINETLQAVRANLQPCDLVISALDDVDDLRVELTGQGPLDAVTNAAACGGEHGYYFKNSSVPTSGAILCPSSCQEVRDQGMQALSVGSRCSG